jgi:hypothetical protein
LRGYKLTQPQHFATFGFGPGSDDRQVVVDLVIDRGIVDDKVFSQKALASRLLEWHILAEVRNVEALLLLSGSLPDHAVW